MEVVWGTHCIPLEQLESEVHETKDSSTSGCLSQTPTLFSMRGLLSVASVQQAELVEPDGGISPMGVHC